MTKKHFLTYIQTPSGKILYNIGVILVVFVLMSFSMTVFAERPGVGSVGGNPVTEYLWRVTHHQHIESLGNNVDYLHGRLYMFKRMQGDPKKWGWDMQTEYDQMYAHFQDELSRYNGLVAKYNSDDEPSQTGLHPKEFPNDPMPYATR